MAEQNANHQETAERPASAEHATTYPRGQVFIRFEQHEDVSKAAREAQQGQQQSKKAAGGSSADRSAPPVYCMRIEDAHGCFDRNGNPNEEAIRAKCAHSRKFQGSYGQMRVIVVREDGVRGVERPVAPEQELYREKGRDVAEFRSGGGREVLLDRGDVESECHQYTLDVRPVHTKDGSPPSPRQSKEVNAFLDQQGITRSDRFVDARRSDQVDRSTLEPRSESESPLGGLAESSGGPPSVRHRAGVAYGAEASEGSTSVRTAPPRPEVVERKRRQPSAGPAPARPAQGEAATAPKSDAARNQSAIRSRADGQKAAARQEAMARAREQRSASQKTSSPGPAKPGGGADRSTTTRQDAGVRPKQQQAKAEQAAKAERTAKAAKSTREQAQAERQRAQAARKKAKADQAKKLRAKARASSSKSTRTTKAKQAKSVERRGSKRRR